jgi:hypothetical protein
MKSLGMLALVFIVSYTGACSSPQKLTVSEPVGPGRSEVVRTGAVQVYTATEQHNDGDNTTYYPHTSYLVCDEQGQKIKYVANHVGTMDENPMLVDLPAGSYIIVGQAEGYGRVRIPMVIKPNRTTVLHLERGWKAPRNAQPSDLIRMPDGQPIGWRAEVAKR